MVSVVVVLAVIILMIIVGLIAVCVCPKTSTTQPEKTVCDVFLWSPVMPNVHNVWSVMSIYIVENIFNMVVHDMFVSTL